MMMMMMMMMTCTYDHQFINNINGCSHAENQFDNKEQDFLV